MAERTNWRMGWRVRRAMAISMAVMLVPAIVPAGGPAGAVSDAAPPEPMTDEPVLEDPIFDGSTAAELDAIFAERGSARILVRLPVPTSLEADLSGPAAAAQRGRIADAGEQLLRALGAGTPDSEARVVHAYRVIPYVALEVTPAGLDAILNSGRAQSIMLDVPVPPARPEPPVDPSSDPALELGIDGPLVDSTDALIQADLVRAAGYDGTGTAVAVLDTGVDSSHPFFSDGASGSRVTAEACFSSASVAYSATTFCPGGTTREEGPGTGDDCPMSVSGCGHGTHVAGIAAGTPTTISGGSYDGIELNGVATGADIVGVQVFARFGTDSVCGEGQAPCTRSWTSDQIAALEWVYEHRDEHSIASVNMSLGGGQYFAACGGDSREAIIAQLDAVGVVTAIAAGNDGWSDSIGAPGCAPSAWTIGSTTKGDLVSYFSNAHPTLIDLYAPGSSILSSLPDGSWARYNGTSMATPQVAGLVALLRQRFPDAANDLLLTALRDTGLAVGVREYGDYLGNHVNFSHPRVRVNAARLDLEGAVSLSVTKSGADTGVVTSEPAGIDCGDTCTIELGEGDDTSYTLTAAPTGLSSTFGGWSGGGCSGTGTCEVTVLGPTTVTASFVPGVPQNDAFANSEAIEAAPYTVSLNTSQATLQSGESTTCEGLSIGRSVWFHFTPAHSGVVVADTLGSAYDTVVGASTGTAVNALTEIGCDDGTAAGGWTDSTVTFPVTAGTRYNIRVGGYLGASGALVLNLSQTRVPSTPATPTVARGNASAVVTISPPANNGAAIDRYEAQCTSSGRPTRTAAGSSATLTVTSLVNGATYACSGRARNAGGWSAWSSTRSVVPAHIPATPARPTVTRGNGSARVSVSAPASNGAAIDRYEAQCTSSGRPTQTAAGSSSTLTVSSLVSGGTYACSMRARNAIGWSAWSSSQSVVAARVPSTPARPTVTRGNGVVSVSVSAPAGNGAAIDRYEARCVASGRPTRTASGTSRALTVTSLVSGATYACSMRARNAVGWSAWSSSQSVVAARVPSTPSPPTVTRGNGSARVSVSAPAGNGAAIDRYEARCVASGRPTRTVSGTSRSLTVSSLVNGVTYSCSMRARNAIGWSAQSSSRTVVPRR